MARIRATPWVLRPWRRRAPPRIPAGEHERQFLRLRCFGHDPEVRVRVRRRRWFPGCDGGFDGRGAFRGRGDGDGWHELGRGGCREGGDDGLDLFGREAGVGEQDQAFGAVRPGELVGENAERLFEGRAEVVLQEGEVSDDEGVGLGMGAEAAGGGEPGGAAGRGAVRGVPRDGGEKAREAAQFLADEVGEQEVEIDDVAAEGSGLHVERQGQAADGEVGAAIGGKQGERDGADSFPGPGFGLGGGMSGFGHVFGVETEVTRTGSHAGEFMMRGGSAARFFFLVMGEQAI